MKIAFFGTPEFAENILSGILEFSEIEIVLVVSQSDKAIGRKKELVPTAVKKIALENRIDVMQPEKLKNAEDFHETLKNLELDFIVVVAYGKIIPMSILEIPKFGCINLHGSILPKYRGASPVQASVKYGDLETGLTTMYMSKGMDEGDMLLTEKVIIEPDDTSLDIFSKFSRIGPELLRKTLVGIISGENQGISQNESEVTYCGKISREDGEVLFQKQSSEEIYNTYRAYTPWPGIYTWYKGKRLVLEKLHPLSGILSPLEEKGAASLGFHFSPKGENCMRSEDENGERCLAKAGIFLKLAKNRYGIICSNGEVLEILQVKLEGKKSIDIQSFVNGNKEMLEYCFQ